MRYARQRMLSEIGDAGQEKLSRASVLIVGVGGLGSPIALYLAGAGVGRIGVIDADTVSLSNLQRQVLYREEMVGQNKATCAATQLSALNSSIKIDAYPYRLDAENAQDIISTYDIVVDGTDNFATRYLIDDCCIALNKVYVYGAIGEFEGMVSVFNYNGTYSYRGLYPDQAAMLALPSPSKAVLGVTPGLVGCAEANEVIKVICGFGEVLSGKLWTIDLATMQSLVILI